MAQQAPTPPVPDLMRLINGYQVTQAIHAAVTLGIPDLLAAGPRDVADLARASRSHEASLYRLLRALAAEGIFTELPGRTFTLTPAGQMLLSTAAVSLAGWAAFVGRPPHWQAWGHLLHSVRTGENAFSAVHGADVWTYRAAHPEESAAFDAAMTSLSRAGNVALLGAYDFGGFHRIADIGGGRGVLLAGILQRHPGATGVLFDQPHVVAGAGALLEEAGVAGRCDVVGGSFFEAVPAADAYIMRAILHDWDDERCAAILRTIRQAASPASRLLVVEQLIEPPNEGARAKFSDLNMLVSAGGLERTREQFGALFASGGWRLEATYPAGRMNVIEGTTV